MDDADMATVRAGGRNELGIWVPSSVKIRGCGAAAFGAIGPGSGSTAKTANARGKAAKATIRTTAPQGGPPSRIANTTIMVIEFH